MKLENIYVSQLDDGEKELRIDLSGDKHISTPVVLGCDKKEIIFKLRWVADEIENNTIFKD